MDIYILNALGLILRHIRELCSMHPGGGIGGITPPFLCLLPASSTLGGNWDLVVTQLKYKLTHGCFNLCWFVLVCTVLCSGHTPFYPGCAPEQGGRAVLGPFCTIGVPQTGNVIEQNLALYIFEYKRKLLRDS